jgi:hypothetical protein
MKAFADSDLITHHNELLGVEILLVSLPRKYWECPTEIRWLFTADQPGGIQKRRVERVIQETG